MVVDFSVGKTQLVLLEWSINSGTIDVKTNGLILEEKLPFELFGLSFFSKLNWGS